jgi:hypothetical protein
VLMLAIVALVWIHFLADFVLQSDAMALKKSSDYRWLLFHSAVYGAPFLIFGPRLAALAFGLHYVVDRFSSLATSRLWQAGERHWFFVVIGLDQAIHLTILVLGYTWLPHWF